MPRAFPGRQQMGAVHRRHRGALPRGSVECHIDFNRSGATVALDYFAALLHRDRLALAPPLQGAGMPMQGVGMRDSLASLHDSLAPPLQGSGPEGGAGVPPGAFLGCAGAGRKGGSGWAPQDVEGSLLQGCHRGQGRRGPGGGARERGPHGVSGGRGSEEGRAEARMRGGQRPSGRHGAEGRGGRGAGERRGACSARGGAV